MTETLVFEPVVHVLQSGGFLVDVGDAFPIWRADMESVRRVLLEHALFVADATSHAQ